MELIYTEGNLTDIRAKQYASAQWEQLGKAYGAPNAYSNVLKYNYTFPVVRSSYIH